MKQQKKRAGKQRNTDMMILTAVAAFLAFLLFLDAFVPVFPSGVTLPDGSDGGNESENADAADGSETPKNWWDQLFDREDDRSAPRFPDEVVYYTVEEKAEWYDALVKCLTLLNETGYEAGTNQNRGVGLFDLDVDGTPEVIVMAYNEENFGYEYIAFDLYSGEQVGLFAGVREGLALTVYLTEESDCPYESMISLYVDDGDTITDNLYTITMQDGLLRETEVMTYSSYDSRLNSIGFVRCTVKGEIVSGDDYENYRTEYDGSHTALSETRMETVYSSTSDTSPEELAKTLLTDEQKFVKP